MSIISPRPWKVGKNKYTVTMADLGTRFLVLFSIGLSLEVRKSWVSEPPSAPVDSTIRAL